MLAGNSGVEVQKAWRPSSASSSALPLDIPHGQLDLTRSTHSLLHHYPSHQKFDRVARELRTTNITRICYGDKLSVRGSYMNENIAPAARTMTLQTLP